MTDTKKIIISDKCELEETNIHYISYKKSEFVRPLCIILPQMSRFIKFFNDSRKSILFLREDEEINKKCNKSRKIMAITYGFRLGSQPVYGKKYIKTKLKRFYGVVSTDFLDNKITKESIHYTRIAAINIDSVIKIDKKNILDGNLVLADSDDSDDSVDSKDFKENANSKRLH